MLGVFGVYGVYGVFEGFEVFGVCTHSYYPLSNLPNSQTKSIFCPYSPYDYMNRVYNTLRGRVKNLVLHFKK